MKMNICRTCLCLNAEKNIRQLPDDIENSKTCFDIFSFCLDINITSNSEITTALCEECYSNIILFYKFKTFALKNENRLKTLANGFVEKETIKFELLNNSISVIINDTLHEGNIDDTSVKNQSAFNALQNIKRENLHENTKENILYKNKTESKTDKLSQQFRKKEKQCQMNSNHINTRKQKKVKRKKAVKEKVYLCNYCDNIFASSEGRRKHYKSVHLGVRQKCNICNKDFINLKSHIKTNHETASQIYKCDFCDRGFIYKSLLAVHMKTHLKGKPYKCDICEKEFPFEARLIQHKRRVHDKEKPHLCQICSKAFFRFYHLEIHLRSHTKEKPYKCDACGKGFSTSTNLKCHKETHVDVKAFSCNQCGKGFATQKYLNVHEITHLKSRTRKFSCTYCDMNFFRSDHRRVHERNAHKELLVT